MKVTTQTIADLAGVSRATVDKVIHNRPGVSDTMRREIRRIMTEQGYLTVQERKKQKGLPASLSPMRIAVIISDLKDDFMTNLSEGIQEAITEFEPYGFTIDCYFCSTYDPQPTLQILEYLKTTPVNAIAMRGFEDTRINKLIDELRDQKIPVFTFDTDCPSSSRVCFFGEDLKRTGRMSASLLCKSIGYQGEIGILIGSKDSFTSSRRTEGFLSYIKEYAPLVTVAAIEETLSQPVITYNRTLQMINDHPNLKGIWNAVSSAEESARAIVESGRKGSIKMGALSFSSEIRELIKAGTIDFAVGQAAFEMGQLMIRTIHDYLAGASQPPKEVIRSSLSIGIDMNIDQLK